jgi:hypothetical protein
VRALLAGKNQEFSLGLGRSCSHAGTERDDVDPLSDAMVGGLELVVAVESIDFYWKRGSIRGPREP